MATDANTTPQGIVTKTATFSGAAVYMGSAQQRLRDMYCRIIYSAASNASGANTVAFSVDTSADGTTWNTGEYTSIENNVVLTTTPQAGSFSIPFSTGLYMRVTATFSGAGSTPTITYQADLQLGRENF